MLKNKLKKNNLNQKKIMIPNFQQFKYERIELKKN